MTVADAAIIGPGHGTRDGAGLTVGEVSAYRGRGYVGPFQLVERQRALALAEHVLSRRRRVKDWFRRGDAHDDRHIDVRFLRELCVEDELLDRVQALLGPDIVLWRSRLFVKAPQGGAIPFHQDAAYYRLERAGAGRADDVRHLGLSAWIALTDSDLGNGCVEILPGSQRETWAHVPVPWPFGIAADPKDVARHRREPMVMKAGQFFLFDNHVVHGSGANTSPRPRVGFAVRYTVPDVRIGERREPWSARATALLVRGGDATRRQQNADPRS
jgi:ectoine hydroxylase-related dioxygenase (phytanoyl-CoA dioxygenase family)